MQPGTGEGIRAANGSLILVKSKAILSNSAKGECPPFDPKRSSESHKDDAKGTQTPSTFLLPHLHQLANGDLSKQLLVGQGLVGDKGNHPFDCSSIKKFGR